MINLKRIKWVFNPQEYPELVFTHAQVPTPYPMKDRIRIFFSGRVNKISHVYSIDISPPPHCEIISINPSAMFLPNEKVGTFDDEGVMPSCFLKVSPDSVYFFYSGWNSRNTIPYHNSTGLAKYDEYSNTISRLYDGPILERNHMHPYLAVTPTVWFEDEAFRALYISGVEWKWGEDRYEPIYVIKQAFSSNLVDWVRPDSQVIKSNYENECFSNPAIYQRKNDALILFCSRNGFDFRSNSDNSYKLGGAFMKENSFNRTDIIWSGKDPSIFEHQMQCYPSFIEWEGKLYTVYNGNSFGLTGFGLAEVVQQ
ncbi:hypothetical protein N8804_01095 [Methylophilaceae bacterium]|nr:hypothetical protein [Methylophilaceae bacterium]